MEASLHFIKVLARAASKDSMIQASASAAEQVLQTGVHEIYKKCVQVRDSISRMQSLWRESRAWKVKDGLVGTTNSNPLPSQVSSVTSECASMPSVSNDMTPKEQQGCYDGLRKDIAEASESREATCIDEMSMAGVSIELPGATAINDASVESRSELLHIEISNETVANENSSEFSRCDTENEHVDGKVGVVLDLTNQSSALEPIKVTGLEANVQETSCDAAKLNHCKQPTTNAKSDKAPEEEESRIKLEQERNKLFSLQCKVRQTLKKLLEREASLHAREAAIEDKDFRMARLAQNLKKQQARVIYQHKKEPGVSESSKRDTEGECKCETLYEERNLILKEREERIARLEKKLRKLQLQLMKKQQEQDFASVMCQVSPALHIPSNKSSEAVQGENHSTQSKICKMRRKRIRTTNNRRKQCSSQYVQTDAATDSISIADKISDSPVEMMNLEPFRFCYDTRVLYPCALRKNSDSSRTQGLVILRPRTSRRRPCILLSRKIKTTDTKRAVRSKEETCGGQNIRSISIEEKPEKCVRFDGSGKEDQQYEARVASCLPLDKAGGILLSSNGKSEFEARNASAPVVPATVLQRDAVSVATKSQAASLYSGYKFSFDWGKSHIDKLQKAGVARNQNNKSRVDSATVIRYSHWLENFDQQIQCGLNNM